MKKYKVNFSGKNYTYRAESAREALEKFSNRKVFGENLILGYKIDQIDATTNGALWARAHTEVGSGFKKVIDVKLLA